MERLQRDIGTKNIDRDTFLKRPSMKLLEIFQKLGREASIISETFFTSSRTACQVGSPGDLAYSDR
jgi:hypothetical protein